MPDTDSEPDPHAIVASLSALQRDIVACGPTSFDEANGIPTGLFSCGEIWESDSGDEWLVWEPTELGAMVRDLL